MKAISYVKFGSSSKQSNPSTGYESYKLQLKRQYLESIITLTLGSLYTSSQKTKLHSKGDGIMTVTSLMRMSFEKDHCVEVWRVHQRRQG